MTDIADLLDAPQDRLAYRMHEFMERLEEKHKEDERRLDRLFEEQRTRLHRVHKKAQSAYKSIFDEMLVKMNHNEDLEVVQWFELALKTKRRDLLGEILAQASSALRDIEKNGGALVCKIQREGSSAGGSCLYSERKNGYFSFLDEFMDGYDDSVAYEVRQTSVSERERKRKKDEEDEAWLKKWRAEREAERVTVEKAAAAVEAAAGTGLFREVAPNATEEAGKSVLTETSANDDFVQSILRELNGETGSEKGK